MSCVHFLNMSDPESLSSIKLKFCKFCFYYELAHFILITVLIITCVSLGDWQNGCLFVIFTLAFFLYAIYKLYMTSKTQDGMKLICYFAAKTPLLVCEIFGCVILLMAARDESNSIYHSLSSHSGNGGLIAVFALFATMAEHLIGSFCILLPLRVIYNMAVNANLQRHLNEIRGFRGNGRPIHFLTIWNWQAFDGGTCERCETQEEIAQNELPPPNYEQVVSTNEEQEPPTYEEVQKNSGQEAAVK